MLEPDRHWGRIRACPTEPPSAAVWIIGGLIYRDPGSLSGPPGAFGAWQIGSTVVPVTAIFNGPGLYAAYCLVLKLPPGDPLEAFLVGDGMEYETADQAEEALMDILRNRYPTYYGYPLCGLILRASPAKIAMEIDGASRGRSYIWPYDLRPLERSEV